jgi:hypothetical protein
MAIEAIWGDLLASPEQVESPGWHREALKETEARVAAGLEEGAGGLGAGESET